MKRTMIHGFALSCLLLSLNHATAQGERLAPADPHGPRRVVPIPNPTPRPTPPNADANPFTRLAVRLGLTAGKSFSTGRVFSVQQNGAIGGLTATYKYTSDGRLMIFPIGNSIRLDLHSGKYYPNTNVIGAKYASINLPDARHLGGGGINLGLNGTGYITAQIQEWYAMHGGHAMTLSSPIQTIRFVPN